MYLLLIIVVISNLFRIIYTFQSNIFWYILAYPSLLSYELTLGITGFITIFQSKILIMFLPMGYVAVHIIKNAKNIIYLRILGLLLLMISLVPLFTDVIILILVITGISTDPTIVINFNFRFTIFFYIFTFVAILITFKLPNDNDNLKRYKRRYSIILIALLLLPILFIRFVDFVDQGLFRYTEIWLYVLDFLLRLPIAITTGLLIYNTSDYLSAIKIGHEGENLTYPNNTEGNPVET